VKDTIGRTGAESSTAGIECTGFAAQVIVSGSGGWWSEPFGRAGVHLVLRHRVRAQRGFGNGGQQRDARGVAGKETAR
jgi:hypothetical protein